jgi:hypothetical protein
MEKIEREHRSLARGRDEATPVRALAAVWLVVAVVAGLVILAGVLIWALMR